MRRRLATAVAALVVGAAPSAVADAPVPTGNARLSGRFLLAGRVTVADNVRGEHRGETVTRTWTFQSECPSGQCPTVTLRRQRAGGSDTLRLSRKAPGYYVGYAGFYRPLRCGSRIYARGERVPFRITVRITLAILSSGQAIASRVNASYRNQVRYNRTPCVAYLGHDAASYHGHILLP